jgi:hypothetical protein
MACLCSVSHIVSSYLLLLSHHLRNPHLSVLLHCTLSPKLLHHYTQTLPPQTQSHHSTLTTMHINPLSHLTPLLLLPSVFSLPTTTLEKRQPMQYTYQAGALSIPASTSPFHVFGVLDFIFQSSDSNIVVYASGTPEWYAGTPYHSCAAPNTCLLTFQTDGNLVRYVNGVATWNTRTGGGIGHTMVISNVPPYLVIYNTARVAVWNSPAQTGWDIKENVNA